MHPVPPVRDILDRSLRTSWIVAVALAATLAPARPRDAAAILAGQLIAFLHFIFLRKIVKLFTESRASGRGRSALPLLITAKVTLVYGGLLALLAWGRMGYAPLCIGFALPFLVLFLKSILLAFGAGPASLTRRGKRGTLGSLGNAGLTALLLVSLAAIVAAPAIARAQGHGAAPTEHTAPRHGRTPRAGRPSFRTGS